MSLLGSDLALGLQTLEYYSPQDVLFRDDTFPCVVGTESRGNLLTVGGKELEVQFTLFIRIGAIGERGTRLSTDWWLTTADSTLINADDFTSRPRTGETVRYKGRRYRIGDVRTDNDEGAWRLELTNPER